MKKIVSINPATGEVNEEFELYSEDRVNKVIKKAKAAFLEWKNLAGPAVWCPGISRWKCSFAQALKLRPVMRTGT